MRVEDLDAESKKVIDNLKAAAAFLAKPGTGEDPTRRRLLADEVRDVRQRVIAVLVGD
jgi:hypothetical protein